MLTWMQTTSIASTRAFSTLSSFDITPSTPRSDAKTSGLKRHNAGYGNGNDLAPGGAD
jgi:hypothetical protein